VADDFGSSEHSMPISWANVASCSPPQIAPAQRWEALNSTYATKPLHLVLLEALGLLKSPLCGSYSPAVPLVEHCLVVGIDTEAWTANTSQMTEIGIVVAEYKHGKELNQHLGHFAEHVLKKMKYYHFRIWENAHLKTRAKWMRGPEGNRFGQSRFVTFAEARSIIDEILNQDIVSKHPGLAGLKRPVVLVGHALAHDKKNMQKNELNYDFKKHGTVVKEIDTQKLVKEVRAWRDPKSPKNDIGLDRLCKEVFGFVHDDAHTALNDAARTVICAVNLALRNWTKIGKTKKTMQEVAWEVEQHSRDNFECDWGTKFCCTQCGGRDHSNSNGQCKAHVYCAACERFDTTTTGIDEIDRAKHAGSHIEQFCPHVAEFGAWMRRFQDAHRKDKCLPPDLPCRSHPWSEWRGKWPLTYASDLLLPEPLKTVQSRHVFVHPLVDATSASAPVSPPVPDVKIIAFQSTGRKREEKARRTLFRTRRTKEGTENDTAGSTTSGSRASSRDTWRSGDAWNGTTL
jgi:hypothetical protein